MIEDASKQLAFKLNPVPQSGNPADVAMLIADRNIGNSNWPNYFGRAERLKQLYFLFTVVLRP